MKITLKTLRLSAEICEAAPPGISSSFTPNKTERMHRFYTHAREMLPAMNELAREMLGLLKGVPSFLPMSDDLVNPGQANLRNEIRRLIERMEEPAP